MNITHRDSCGTVIHFGELSAPDSCVRVVAYGFGARAADCGTVSRVVGVNRTTVAIIDADGNRRNVRPTCLLVISLADYLASQEA